MVATSIGNEFLVVSNGEKPKKNSFKAIITEKKLSIQNFSVFYYLATLMITLFYYFC